MTASNRCMRFTTAALACNAACVGFATGFAKAPSQGVSRHSFKSAAMRIGGPLRGLVQGAERAAQDEARRAGGRRFLAALHGVQDGAVGAQDSDASSDKVRAHGIGVVGAVVGWFPPHVVSVPVCCLVRSEAQNTICIHVSMCRCASVSQLPTAFQQQAAAGSML